LLSQQASAEKAASTFRAEAGRLSGVVVRDSETFHIAANYRGMSLQDHEALAPRVYFFCDRCHGIAMLTSVEPHPRDGSRSEVHTFECLECGQRESFRKDLPRS
jgi:hypothetical protein